MPLRVLSYNILYGGEERVPQIIDVIREQKPDAVALLEANSRANAEEIARTLGMQLIFGEANSEFHIAWLSRLPIVRTQNHRLPVLAKTLLEIEVSWGSRLVHLFASHLLPGRDREDDEERAGEMRAILEVLRSRSGQPRLLVGDMNSVRPGDPLGPTKSEHGSALTSRLVIPLVLAEGYVDCYRELHPDEPGYTYKLPEPWLRLDYLFASPELAPSLRASGVVTSGKALTASDHLPVWAEFA